MLHHPLVGVTQVIITFQLRNELQITIIQSKQIYRVCHYSNGIRDETTQVQFIVDQERLGID